MVGYLQDNSAHHVIWLDCTLELRAQTSADFAVLRTKYYGVRRVLKER